MNTHEMMRRLGGAFLLVFAAGPWNLGLAQIFDFSGQWDMSTDLTAPGQAAPCSYFGTAQVVHDLQTGSLSGTAVLELGQGPEVCPAEMAGEISGTPDGPMIFGGTIFGGVWGDATFTGGLIPGKGSGVVLGGGINVVGGPFDGATGAWGGMVSDGVFKDGFETLIVVSASTSLLVLLAAGMLIHRRRV